MKRFLLSILMVVIGLSAFSQSPSRIISLSPAYPLVVGESSVDGITIDNNGLCMTDTPIDSLPHYEIGQIFEQTVRCSSEDGHGFYVKADSLHSLNVTYSYEVKSEAPNGIIEFNETTGRFKYFPAVDDYKSFIVTFTATNGVGSVSEDVVFSLMPQTPSEITVFQSEGTMPDATDYTVIAETTKELFLNNQERTAYSISISGKDVIFDNAIQNKVWGLCGREDIYELNIYAERLIVRSALSFPQTNITIYAKELIFEDKGAEYASINTTPSLEKTLTDGEGINGGNAGYISLYIKEFKGNIAKRLILNGAKGQSTNRNGTPGKGGNGGVVKSTIDVSSYCDFARGSGGVKYDADSGASDYIGSVIGHGENGSSGSIKLVNRPHAYLHPYYLSAIIRHAKDAFINNHVEYVLQTCKDYRTLIDEYVNSYEDSENGGVNEGVIDDLEDVAGSRKANTSDIIDLIIGGEDNDESDDGLLDRKLELQNVMIEIGSLLFNLEQGLDYFGNPAGWVPLLSFEAYLKNYDNEIDRAIPTLYTYYWMNRIDRTLQEKVRASQLAADETEKEIEINQESLNLLILEIPVLQDEADELNRMIQELTIRIETLQNQLIAQATKNVKRRHWLSNLFGIGKVVANVVSVFGPVGAAIGNTINVGLNMASNISEVSSAVNAIGNHPLDSINSSLYYKDKNGNILPYDFWTSYSNVINKQISPLVNNINNLNGILSRSVSNSEVQAEYNKLIANSPLWKELNNQFDELKVRKEELVNHINDVFSNMTSTISELSNDALALDAFRRDAFTGNSKRDLNAMLYIEKMEQRAKNRLLLYDYYLRKAYEYRLLKPYEGEEFNLGGMFDRLETLGMALDSVVNVSAYNTLSSVYRERVSDMTHRIIEEYTYNQPEKTSTPRTYRIPKDKLDALNTNGSVTLNMYEMGFFSPTEENIRITDFGVSYIKAHSEGELGNWGELSLEMSHSGISKFRKDGQIYCFDHMAINCKNNYYSHLRSVTNPHFWTTKIDMNSLPEVNNPNTDKNSVAISSLLSSILDYDTEKVMLFSRPSVWSDITLTKSVHTDREEDILIDSLVLKLSYDYTRRTKDICNIDISTSDDFMPYIACSEKDFSGRGGGRGKLFRSFGKSSRTVTFTAAEKYETYYFVNWTTRAGKVVSDKPELKVSKDKDQNYIANYERRVPILNVADTIRVGNSKGTYVVNVSNIGSGNTEMDWYVEDSIKTGNWIHLGNVVEGIDNGSFTFSYDANTTGRERVDSIEIFAPETDEMSKVIYIVQGNLLKGDVNKDGSVDVADIAAIIRYMAGQTTGLVKEQVDVNKDDNVDVADISAVISIMAANARVAQLE